KRYSAGRNESFSLHCFILSGGKKMEHRGTKTIETPRLILRMAQMTDSEPMFRNWASDPEVTKFLTWPTYQSIDSAYTILDLWIKEYEKPDFYQWMIELKEIGEPIGSISVVHLRDDIAAAEIGYCIGQSWWHKGIMTEALTAVMKFLFTEVGMNRIEAKHDINNPHSGGVMKKCGMKYEGTSRASDRNNQGICDIAQYAIIQNDWVCKL
ncbi:MAG: GNAT family N-acetyltransferase, partial [Lachnospiraceae bacterium]|nr:GNAT family N-acetyltransferase [Lachnospiraceae bacterium]